MRAFRFAAVLLPVLGAALPVPSLAVPADGTFVARQACDATQSIRGRDATAPARLEVDRAYRIVEANAEPATHVLVEVPRAAPPTRRWVAVTCGERMATATVAPKGPAATPPADPSALPAAPRADAGTSTRNILAISWQPAFCEGRPDRPECRTQTPDRPDARRFSLHGLWPQPREREYCGDAALLKAKDAAPRWRDLPAPALSGETRRRLDAAMPGAQSALDRHEWARHGSCYGGDAEEYFSEMLAMLDAINGSAVGELFASRLGQEVTVDEIRAAFDQAFGPGAGERVRVACRDDGRRRLVTELTIGLNGPVAAEPDLPALLRGARPTQAGCPAGIVDAAGAQ